MTNKYIEFFQTQGSVNLSETFIGRVKYRISEETPTDYMINEAKIPKSDEGKSYCVGEVKTSRKNGGER